MPAIAATENLIPRRRLAVVAMVLVASLALSSTSSAQTAMASAAARVIVKYKADSPLARRQPQAAGEQRMAGAQVLGRRMGMALRAGAEVAERVQVLHADGMTSRQLALRISAESDVEYAVPDERRRRFTPPGDPLYLSGPPVAGRFGGPVVGQWYLRAPAGEVQSAIDVETAWRHTTGSPGIVVAVLDTGVRFDHPDLLRTSSGGNLLPGYDMISDLDVANDGDGRDGDPSDPGDWLTQEEVRHAGGPFEDCAPGAEDSSWHGTQTSGLVGALTNNGIGMAGLGRGVRVLPVRVLGKCGGFDSDIIAGMRWAAGLPVAGMPGNPTPARVLNLSLGGEGGCTAAYRDVVAEINAVGAVVVAAAGNSTGHAVSTPANCPGVVAVGGLRHVGTKVGFSDLGPEIAISAPAGNCVDIGPDDPCRYPILTTFNAGLTAPVAHAAGGSTYTDSFNASVGTSFSAPLVAGTAALMLSAQPALTPADVRRLLQVTARPFPTTGGDNGDGTPVPQCTVPTSNPFGSIDQLQCYCTTATCGAGMLDAGAAVAAALGLQAPGAALNFQGLWWNAPAGSEAGWGINFAHQGDVIFATWFTYDGSGNPWWLSMTAERTAANIYTGTLYRTTGPAFNAVPFDPVEVQRVAVGAATLTFGDGNSGSFAYVVSGVAQTKSIVRQVFGPLPTCTFGSQPDLALATNYQDLWYAAPAESESGWGVNLTHQGDTIFATWFTYDLDRAPLWLSATLTRTPGGTYTGALIRTSGPAFNAVPFNPSAVTRIGVGTATLSFSSGGAATFAYDVNDGIRIAKQSKAITRQVFRKPGTACR